MDRIFNILQKHRLDRYYRKFIDLGVTDEIDFLDGFSEEDLNNIGLSQVEKNRFKNMQELIKRLGNSAAQVMPVTKSVGRFNLFYSFPKCPEPRELKDIDPAQNTVEDLMLRISHQEGIDNSMGVCLFTAEGMPLSDDPFFNTWSLNDRHIETGSHLYAIFTPKHNLKDMPRQPQTDTNNSGLNTVRCHIMLRGNYDIKVDLENHKLADLKKRLATESGIPVHVLHFRDLEWSNSPLKDIGIDEDSLVHFSLSSFTEESQNFEQFLTADVQPSVQQSPKGMSVFFSTLYSARMKEQGEKAKNVVAYIRKLTGCHGLAQILHQTLCKNVTGTNIQKIALVEGLYFLFRELLPSRSSTTCSDVIIEDSEVFEYSPECWGYLLSQSEEESTEYENFAPIFLECSSTRKRFSEPVRIANLPDICERSAVLQAIEDEEKMPNCSLDDMRKSIKRDTTMEKIILSIPPVMKTFPMWLNYEQVTGNNFRMEPEKSFSQMKEDLVSYPHLQITPPLQPLHYFVEAPCLMYLSENNLGVYSQTSKAGVGVLLFNCLTGKTEAMDLKRLAEQLGDMRTDQLVRTSRTPKEAIMVLLDTSSSMKRDCYSDIAMTKLSAVKELFNAFANRSMAYDLPHLISLVTFGGKVKTIHTFTENLEKFKEYVHSLTAKTGTLLYDALDQSVSELTKIKARFPDCLLRVICLSDGKDFGSLKDPVAVTNELMSSNIVVDSILVGNASNVLHGISNVTGGCCFKPDTSKTALKLFEMETVLSLESRKLKPKSASPIQTVNELKGLFAKCGYDNKPEVKFPAGVKSKVVMTEDALKKKILESKTTRFMEKDKRIVEELKSLHCDPHPYCSVFPSDTDFTFWKILMQGPPDTPYEGGVFELYCQFGDAYPVKPPLVRFITPVYHCNINSVGRICHNIFDRNYSANVTMREILNAVYGLLIAPEPDDPLDSVLAEEFMSDPNKYKEEAKKNTETSAKTSLNDMEEKLLGPDAPKPFVPPQLICPLTKRMFVDPVMTTYGTTYERGAIENYLKETKTDPLSSAPLDQACLRPDKHMKHLVANRRVGQIKSWV
ncbi:hypothetical protein ACEWY4_011797 [Coilia grayii]|uniref:Uncharacterized protein n=1 Tax=Coilia grayii TaxID=363190 RepID=A0ABD1JYN8_9TELE